MGRTCEMGGLSLEWNWQSDGVIDDESGVDRTDGRSATHRTTRRVRIGEISAWFTIYVAYSCRIL